jgi:hypothetical protein
MTRRSLILLAALLASCGGADDHPFDRVGRSLAEPETPALRALRGLPAGEATAAAAGSQGTPAADPKQGQKDAEALAEKHGFSGVEDYRATWQKMRAWKEFLGRNDRRAGARAELKSSTERSNAALAGQLPPTERERNHATLKQNEQEHARLDAEEKQAPPGDDDERAAYERNRKAFEAADKRR